MAMRLLSLLPLIFVVAACAAPTTNKEFEGNVRACSLLSASDCQSMLDKKKIVGRPQSEVLMSVALTEMTKPMPDTGKAISFLDAIVDRDPTYALAHQNLGAMLLMSAKNAKVAGNQIRALGDSMGAINHLMRAIKLDPEQEMPYSLAVAATGFVGDCTSAYVFQQAHFEKFGASDEHTVIEAAMTKLCPSFQP